MTYWKLDCISNIISIHYVPIMSSGGLAHYQTFEWWQK